MFDPLVKNGEIVLGVAAGVIGGTWILGQLGSMFSLGTSEDLILRGGVVVGALLAFGNSKPKATAAFCSVLIAQGLAGLFPATTP